MELKPQKGLCVYQFGSFLMDTCKRTLYQDGMPVAITPKAFDTLSVLVQNNGRVLARSEMMKLVWPGSFVEELNLKVQISILRKVLGESPSDHKFIVTVPGRGYSFVAPVNIVEDRRHPAPANLNSSSQPLTLAVLTFKFRGRKNEDEYLTTILRDALITKLSQVKHISVRSFINFPDFLNSDHGSPYASHLMDTEFLLAGSIQKSDERVRINVQLIRTSDGTTAWADNFDEDISDIFVLQDSISQQVTNALSIELTIEETRMTKKPSGIEATASQPYLKGRYFWEKRSESAVRKSLEYFIQATIKDPDYALAYAGIADSYNLLGEYLYLSPQKAFPEARIAAMKALELDQSVSTAYVTMAEIKLFFDWDFAGSEAEFIRAIELNPFCPSAHHSYAWLLLVQERYDEALKQFQYARQLSPLSLTLNTAPGFVFFYRRLYDEAIDYHRQTLDLDPVFAYAHYCIASCLLQKGAYEESIEAFNKAGQMYLESSSAIKTLDEANRVRLFPQQVLAQLGYCYAKVGNREKVAHMLDVMTEISYQKYISPYCMAVPYLAMEEKNKAIYYLRKAVEERSTSMIFLAIDPLFDDLRYDPEIEDMIYRIGLTRKQNK